MANGAELGRYLGSLEPQMKEVFGCPYHKPAQGHPYIRVGVKPSFVREHDPVEAASVVRSSFSDVERKFLNLAFVQIGSLATGKNLLDANDIYPTMAERVIEEYRAQSDKPPVFSRPVARAFFKLFRDFDGINPAFRPVIQRMVDVDGDGGFTTIPFATPLYLDEALRGGPKLAEEVTHKLDHISYVKKYKGYSMGEDFQIWCPGEALSKIVIPEIAKAAEELAKDPKVRRTYDVSQDVSLREPRNQIIFTNQIIDLFSALYNFRKRPQLYD